MQRVNVNKLGVFLDGWSELIDGQAAAADGVREYVKKHLEAREMPQVVTETTAGFASAKEADRPYLTSARSPGVTSTILITPHGEDLYVSWKTFQKNVINWRQLGVLAALALLLGFLLPYLTYGLFVHLVTTLFLWILWLAFFLAIVVGLPYGAWYAYQHFKKTAYFQQHLELTSELDKVFTIGAIALGLLGVLLLVNIIPPPGRLWLPPLSYILGSTIRAFIVLNLLGIAIGFLRHGHPFAYIIRVPTLFDADDAIALNRSVHKTIIHGLDHAGIDTSLLHTGSSVTKGRLAEQL